MKISATATQIHVEIPFEQRAEVTALRGARWNPRDKLWGFPATPHAAQCLVEAFPQFQDHPHLQTFLDTPLANYSAARHLTEDFKTELWAHQKAAVEFAWNRPATMLAMEMRTGKTAVAIALASLWGSKCILVTCPLSVVGVWEAEIALHSDLPWYIVRLDKGSVKEKTEKLIKAMKYHNNLSMIVIVNHESLWREPFGKLTLELNWELVIVDESHRAKAPGGKLSRYLGRLADHVPKRLALTGTPLPHSPLDAYAQYRFLDRSLYGSNFNRFKNRYAITGGFQKHEIIGWQNMDEFSDRFHEIAFEVTTDEAFDLPEEMDIRRSTTLEPKAQKIYDSMEKNFWAEVESGEVTASNALVKLLRLQQVTSGWLKGDDGTMIQVSTEKMALFFDVLEDFKIETPLVIFVRFTKDIEMVRLICEKQKRRVGEVSGQQKDLTDAGTFPENLDVLICQIQSGSLGINLSRASTSIFYSWGWSLGDVEQARARIRHADQKHKLQFIHLVIENSIDDRMMGCLKKRKDFIEDVLEKGRPT